MVIKDSNVTILVKDIDGSISFYRSIGFTLKNRWGNHYAQVTAPGITIGLHPSGGGSSPGSGNTSIGFIVDNFEETQSPLNGLSINNQSRQEEGG
jgi:catechol 2,3-dioxygenase-like lactoylglutathione lyase family enzyme